MSIFDNLITLDKKGQISYSNWIEWMHVSMGFMHCKTCLALDKCWFDKHNMPELPQHEKCHCRAIRIAKPNAYLINAECDIRKFTDYIFSDKYAWNGKRELFESLGFDKNESQYLKDEFEAQAAKNYSEGNYKLNKLDEQGQRINIEIKMNKNNREIEFISGWMVKLKGRITNNTPLADD